VGAKEQSGRTLVFSLPGSRDRKFARSFPDPLSNQVAIQRKSLTQNFKDFHRYKSMLEKAGNLKRRLEQVYKVKYFSYCVFS
jgi:hypothetical protein